MLHVVISWHHCCWYHKCSLSGGQCSLLHKLIPIIRTGNVIPCKVRGHLLFCILLKMHHICAISMNNLIVKWEDMYFCNGVCLLCPQLAFEPSQHQLELLHRLQMRLKLLLQLLFYKMVVLLDIILISDMKKHIICLWWDLLLINISLVHKSQPA